MMEQHEFEKLSKRLDRATHELASAETPAALKAVWYQIHSVHSIAFSHCLDEINKNARLPEGQVKQRNQQLHKINDRSVDLLIEVMRKAEEKGFR